MANEKLRADIVISLFPPTVLFTLIALFAPLSMFPPYRPEALLWQVDNFYWMEIQAIKMAIPMLIFRRLPFLPAYFVCFVLMVLMIRVSPPPGDPGMAVFLLPTMPLVPYGFERMSDAFTVFVGQEDFERGNLRLELFLRLAWSYLISCHLIFRVLYAFAG